MIELKFSDHLPVKSIKHRNNAKKIDIVNRKMNLNLQLIQSEIKTFKLHQLGVVSCLDYPSSVQHDNFISPPGRRKPVGDNYGRSVCHEIK